MIQLPCILITVYTHPVFVCQPKATEVLEGSSFHMVITARGNPVPNITWSKDGKALEDGDVWGINTSQDKEKQQATCILAVKSASFKEHDGNLCVSVQNKVGKVQHDVNFTG